MEAKIKKPDDTQKLLGVKKELADTAFKLNDSKNKLSKMRTKMLATLDSTQRSLPDAILQDVRRQEEYLAKREGKTWNAEDLKRISDLLQQQKAVAALVETTERRVTETRMRVEKLEKSVRDIEDGLCSQVLSVAATNRELQKAFAASGLSRAKAFDYTSVPGGCALDDDPFL